VSTGGTSIKQLRSVLPCILEDKICNPMAPGGIWTQTHIHTQTPTGITTDLNIPNYTKRSPHTGNTLATTYVCPSGMTQDYCTSGSRIAYVYRYFSTVLVDYPILFFNSQSHLYAFQTRSSLFKADEQILNFHIIQYQFYTYKII
jgi:hypothetical protein